jgi:hypothetical protein
MSNAAMSVVTWQVGTGDRGDVTILPTLVINQRQYRGKLDKAAVIKAICSGYKESTDPPVCLSQSVETNECLTNNGGCWQKGNITACQDTFRGRICVCPLVEGVQFEGDGYSNCQGNNIAQFMTCLPTYLMSFILSFVYFP